MVGNWKGWGKWKGEGLGVCFDGRRGAQGPSEFFANLYGPGHTDQPFEVQYSMFSRLSSLEQALYLIFPHDPCALLHGRDPRTNTKANTLPERELCSA